MLSACAPARTGAPGGPSVAPPFDPTQTQITGPLPGEARQLTGTGSSFAYLIVAKWSDDYYDLTDVAVNYQSTGSGAGIRAISDQTVDFAGTDSPMTDEQLRAAEGGEVLHIPVALGAVVPIYNVPEVGDTALKFSGETLAGIFLGRITRWNDRSIAADNPGVDLPNQNIVAVHRSDGSGTTFIWADYLSSVSPEWKAKVGAANAVDWPVGIGAPQNAGVAGEVSQRKYAIGYVEFIYAKANNIAYGKVKNQAGTFIEASLDTITAAAKDTESFSPDLRVSIVNPPDAGAYPIAGFTWQLVYVKQQNKAVALALTRWLWYEVTAGQQAAASIGYAPLPEDVQAAAQAMIKRITIDGQQAFPGS